MTAYRLELWCPTCPPHTPVTHVTGGRPTSREVRAVVRCTRCRAQYVIAVSLLATAAELAPGEQRPHEYPIEHGTDRGYGQHRRTDQRHRLSHPDACLPCISAHASAKRRTPPTAASQLTLTT